MSFWWSQKQDEVETFETKNCSFFPGQVPQAGPVFHEKRGGTKNDFNAIARALRHHSIEMKHSRTFPFPVETIDVFSFFLQVEKSNSIFKVTKHWPFRNMKPDAAHNSQIMQRSTKHNILRVFSFVRPTRSVIFYRLQLKHLGNFHAVEKNCQLRKFEREKK